MPSGSGNKWTSTSDRFLIHGTKAPSGLQTLLVESRYTSEMFKPEMVLLVTFTPVGDFTGTKAGQASRQKFRWPTKLVIR